MFGEFFTDTWSRKPFQLSHFLDFLNRLGAGRVQSVQRTHTPGCRTVQSFYSCRGSRFFSFPKPKPALGPIHLPTERVPRAAYPGVKWWKRDANHSSPSSAEIKNEWRHTATLPYVVMARTGTNLAQPSVDYTNTYIHRHIHIKYIDTYIHTHTHTYQCVVRVHVC